jgi:hypothetical protein
MIADGLDLRTVQEICGHKDIDTTMRYAHLLGDSIKKAARAFSIVPSTGQANHLGSQQQGALQIIAS